jgi:hypothetical protein
MGRILARGAFIAPSYLLGRAALARQGDALVLVDRGGEVRAPLTFSRAQAAGVEATGFDGVSWRSYGADVPRWVGAEARLLIGGQRTNLFTTVRAPATETVTVTAAAHTLSLIGTGSITLSGVATGTLAGTGANDRVTLTFTPSAGSLTLTVAGSITLPQLELGSFASTPILPPIGTPAASMRGTDILTALLSDLDIGSNGACTVLWRGAFSATNIGNSQTIAAIDDGTAANRCEIRLTSTGIPEVIRVTAGVVAQSNFGGAPPTPGATMRAGFTLDGAGRLAGVVAGYNGGAVEAVAGTATVGLSTFRHGTSVGNSRELWGETHTLTVMPPRSDAEMQALVAAL